MSAPQTVAKPTRQVEVQFAFRGVALNADERHKLAINIHLVEAGAHWRLC